MRLPATAGLLALCLLGPAPAIGQEPAPARDAATREARDSAAHLRDSVFVNGITAGEADAEPRRRRFVGWNEYDGPITTFRFGAGFLVDYGTFAQDSVSREQISVTPGVKIRDFRLILGGRFKTERRVTWQMGLMYDGPSNSWFVRQTGIMVAVPEAWGHLFIGRAKEGVSLNRVMVGYDGWGMERFTFSETVPLLADGVKWLGYLPDRHLIWNVGLFTDAVSEGQSFSSYDHQFTARVAWVPMVSDSVGTLLHIGLNFRTGQVNNGQLQLRARPEAFLAPYFLDTGKFPASRAGHIGLEAYYRPGPWLIGAEYYVENVRSPQTHDPLFHGGGFVTTYLITGETRSYNTVGGYFRDISPARTVFEGGPGALEAVLMLSYSDLDGGTVRGGRFGRLTPMVNWYLSDNARIELAYGYGRLNRFDKVGTTQFLQSRLQLQF